MGTGRDLQKEELYKIEKNRYGYNEGCNCSEGTAKMENLRINQMEKPSRPPMPPSITTGRAYIVIDSIEKTIYTIDEKISHLEEKIRPILLSSCPKCKENIKPDRQPSSPFTEGLMELCDRLDNISYKLSEMIDRVDI